MERQVGGGDQFVVLFILHDGLVVYADRGGTVSQPPTWSIDWL